MAEIVNLRQERKRRDRAVAAGQAAANRARHGRTRAEREAEALAERQRLAVLDGARLDRPPAEGPEEA